MTQLMKQTNGHRAFDEIANDLLDNIFTPMTRNTYSDYSYVEKDEDTITVHINATGLGKEDITIKSKDGHLIITSDLSDDDLTPLTRNIGHRYRVPKGYDSDSAVAHFKNGILTISLEKSEETKNETVIDIQ